MKCSSTRWYYLSQLIALAVVISTAGLVSSCSEGVNQPNVGGVPADTTDPGENGGGNDNEPGDYGVLFFRSNSDDLWDATGPVFFNEAGDILADNTDQDTLDGQCTLRDAIDFNDAVELYFVWKGGATFGGEYSFSIGNPGRWMNYPFEENLTGWEVAEVNYQFGFGQPLYCRFEFRLPPTAKVRITDFRAYGK